VPSPPPLTALLHPYLDDALPRLERYFSDKTGRRFERLDGGGDRSEVADRFTADDLVAVSMLGVEIHPQAAIAILETQATELNGLLAEIPNHVDLWDVPEAVVTDNSPADRLWHSLVAIHGIGPVIAGKLLARKRPRLIPVYDSVVSAAVGESEQLWLTLRTALQDNGLRTRLAALRAESKVGTDISLLRILDVAIWMSEGTSSP
jgi:hypothetical protein